MQRAYLEPLLDRGLCVVFVGSEPGPTSLKAGHYYANHRNSFWRDLRDAGFMERLLNSESDDVVLDLGIGLDDVYLDPRGLRRRLESSAPRAVCFNSKGALERASGATIGRDAWTGADASAWISFAGVDMVWAVPDSSPKAERMRPQRLRLLAELREHLADCLPAEARASL